MKKIILLSLVFWLSACSQAVLVQSSGTNSTGNEIMVDKRSKSVISVGNDKNGILINIRIPDSYDQYKVLKYGGYLALAVQKNFKKAYVIAYPISNQDKKLRIPIEPRKSENFPMDSLLVNLSKEAGTMKIFNFYSHHSLILPSKIKDSVAVDVYHEPGEKGALVYTAYIPYNSIAELNTNDLGNSKIRISFASGALEVHHFYGGGPGFAPTFTYSIPRTKQQIKMGIYPPQPDPKLVEKLAVPVAFDADLTLAVK